MIGQYLSNTNEIGTIHVLQNILELNKALTLICVGVCDLCYADITVLAPLMKMELYF